MVHEGVSVLSFTSFHSWRAQHVLAATYIGKLYNLCVRHVCESACEKGEGDESYVEGMRVVSGEWYVEG